MITLNNLFSNKGKGAMDTPVDERDFQRPHFFGSDSDRKIPKHFDHTLIYPTKNQLESMACGYFSGIRLLEVKYYMNTGKLLNISNERIFELWDQGCSLGFGDKTRGSFIYDVLKFLQKHPQVFKDSNGEDVKIWVQDYFVVDRFNDQEYWEEIYYGGGVLTGTSSRLGLNLIKAKFRPYLAESKKANKNDGHAFPAMGRGYEYKDFVNRRWINKTAENASKHPNSWGEKWGLNGAFYTTEEQRTNLFRCWGFTIGHDGQEIVKEPEKIFKDVSNSSWAYESIKYCKEKGIFKGTQDGLFLPDKPISRAELATVLHRLLEE